MEEGAVVEVEGGGWAVGDLDGDVFGDEHVADELVGVGEARFVCAGAGSWAGAGGRTRV